MLAYIHIRVSVLSARVSERCSRCSFCMHSTRATSRDVVRSAAQVCIVCAYTQGVRVCGARELRARVSRNGRVVLRCGVATATVRFKKLPREHRQRRRRDRSRDRRPTDRARFETTYARIPTHTHAHTHRSPPTDTDTQCVYFCTHLHALCDGEGVFQTSPRVCVSVCLLVNSVTACVCLCCAHLASADSRQQRRAFNIECVAVQKGGI